MKAKVVTLKPFDRPLVAATGVAVSSTPEFSLQGKNGICVVTLLFPVFFNFFYLGPVRIDDHMDRNPYTLETTSVSSNIEHRRNRKIK